MENKDDFSVQRMCQLLNVTTDAFYAWQRRGLSFRAIEDQRILEQITAIRTENRKKREYGSPRLTDDLKDAGFTCGHNRVARIMRENDIYAETRKKHRYKVQKNNDQQIAENILDRNFSPDEPNRAWATDITYIWTQKGWAYLCVFIDLFSKMVVGWTVSKNPNTDLVLKAFGRGLRNRSTSMGMIVHSDRGCQYTSIRFCDTVSGLNFRQSMSRKGNCWDNACVESFFGHFKAAVVVGHAFQDIDELELAVFDYIEGFYNRERRHAACGNLSPVKYEEQYVA
jgi:transposase InsO family protein